MAGASHAAPAARRTRSSGSTPYGPLSRSIEKPVALLTALKQGTTLRNLKARRLGGGCYKTAYRVGDYVIKRNSFNHDMGPFPVTTARKMRIYKSPEWRVNGWIIQPFLRSLDDIESARVDSHNYPYDLKSDNCGVGPDGHMYAFDWLND